jgi:hypothetical protein
MGSLDRFLVAINVVDTSSDVTTTPTLYNKLETE